MDGTLVTVNENGARKILDGTKTQMRRLVQMDPDDKLATEHVYRVSGRERPVLMIDNGGTLRFFTFPFPHEGAKMAIREPWRIMDDGNITYASDGNAVSYSPAYIMRRTDVRLQGVVTRLWVEKVSETTDDGVVAEGFDSRDQYSKWVGRARSNMVCPVDPYVCVCEFERVG